MDRLLIHPYCEADEALSGYFLRLAGLNGYRRPSEIILLAGLSYQGEKTLRRLQITSTAIKKLSVVTCRAEGELRSLSYQPEVAVTNPSYVMWGNRRMPLISLRLTKVCVCSVCLSEKLYVRQAWDWDVLPLCLEHECILLDGCQACGKRITRQRAKIHLCSCGADFRDAQIQFLSKEVVADFRVMLAQVEDGSVDGCAFIRACAVLAALSICDSEFYDDLGAFDALPISHQYGALARVLEAGRRQAMPELIAAFSEARLMRVGLAGPRAAILPFIEHQALLVPLGAFDTADVLKRVNAKFVAGSKSAGTAQATDFERNLIETSSVAFVLGVSARLVARFFEVGALHPARGPTVDGFGTWKFRWDDVIGLLRKAHARGAHVDADVFSFEAANLPGHVPGIQGTARLVGALRAGKLQVVGFDPLVGLPSLRYQVVELPVRVFDDTFSVREVAGRLQIYTDAVYRIIHAKILVSKKIGRKYYVKSSDLSSFESTYVFVRELATSVGANPTNFSEKLMAFGVEAVSGPKIDGTLIYLFRRDDVRALDLRAVAALDDYDTSTGRKPTSAGCSIRSVSSAVAAARLRISVQQLSSLVRNHFIREVTGVRGSSKARQFRERELARYEAAFRHNAELVSLEQACATLKVSRRYIQSRWLGPQTVRLISDGLVRYLRRTDLAKMQAERDTALTVQEVAAELGIAALTLHNWLKIGRIRASNAEGRARNEPQLISRDSIGTIQVFLAQLVDATTR